MPGSGKKSTKVFILTGEWQDVRGKNVLKFVGTSDELGTVEMIFPNTPVFFIERKSFISNLSVSYNRKEVDLKNFDEKKVDELYFKTQRDLRTAAEELERMSISTFESDVGPARRVLMERIINAQVRVDGICNQKNNLNSFTNTKVETYLYN